MSLTLAATGAAAAKPDAISVLPDPAKSIVNEDGSTTLIYDDGASFTSGGGFSIFAGSFTWSANYSVSVTSREWTTGGAGDLWIDVNAISNCGINQNLTLYRSVTFGWSKVGTTRSVRCSGGSYVWRNVSQGKYRFQLDDPNTSDRWFPHEVSGKVRYA